MKQKSNPPRCWLMSSKKTNLLTRKSLASAPIEATYAFTQRIRVNIYGGLEPNYFHIFGAYMTAQNTCLVVDSEQRPPVLYWLIHHNGNQVPQVFFHHSANMSSRSRPETIGTGHRAQMFLVQPAFSFFTSDTKLAKLLA